MDLTMLNCFTYISVLVVSVSVVCGLEMTILHTNDIHARFEQFNKYGSECKQADADGGKCFGGVARRLTKIQEIRGSHDNVLLLDAGDQFTGTPFFTVHRGMATSHFMNLIDYDVMCLGNHEFDLSVPVLVKFLDNVTFPVVSCNTDISREPVLQISKRWTTTVDGEKIGVIGYVTPETAQISNPGPTISFDDVIECVKDQVTALEDEGIHKIIALGHAGFDIDQQVAAIDGVDIVIGGHSNTFLYTGDQPSNDEVDGPYPVVVDQPDGGKGLVVQAFMWGKYLGYLNVTFDADGEVTAYAGNPILLDASITQDADVLQQVATWKIPVDEEMGTVVGSSNVLLVGDGDVCRLQECNMGNIMTDAIVAYHVNFSHPASQWAPAAIALWNAGGIRESIGKGAITLGDLRTVLPYNNEIDLVTLSGENIREQLEVSVQDMNTEAPPGGFMQMSGMRVVYDMDKPAGDRVTSVEVLCLECDVPSYSPLENTKDYKLYIPTFIINGGDGYSFQPSHQERFNTLDYVPLMSYMKERSPVYPAVEGSIQFVKGQQTSGSTASHVTGSTLIISTIIYSTMFWLL